MERVKVVALALMMTASSAALAQTSESPTTTASTQTAGAAAKTNPTDLQQQVTSSFQSAGFTDVKVMPDSFLVLAKDKSGNPVTIFISPGSVTEVTAANANNRQNSGRSSSGMFANIPSSERLSSSVIGLDVYNDKNQDIGTIKDFALDKSGLTAYIVGVGGFIGMGEHYVAVLPSAITLIYDAGTKIWHAVMNANADQ